MSKPKPDQSSDSDTVPRSGSGASDAATLRDTLPVGTLIKGYEVLGILGAGGFGKVYLSHDPHLDLPVAIKEYFPETHARRIGDEVIPISGSEESYDNGRQKFDAEARTLAAFKHHSIVEIYGILEANNTKYMVMEYLGDRTLARFAEEHGGKLPEHLTRELLEPLLEALDLVHADGKVHRDISPDNIMIRADGSPVLLDFGNVREALLEDEQVQKSRKVSKSTAVINDGFSPIELYNTKKQDLKPATDIYSLAAVLYLVITGERPVPSTARFEDDMSVGGGVSADGPLVPFAKMKLEGEYSSQFLAAIEQSLSLRQRDRPQSIAEFRDALATPVAAGGAGQPNKGWIIGGATLALVALVSGSIFYLENDTGPQPAPPRTDPVVTPDPVPNPTPDPPPVVEEPVAPQILARIAQLAQTARADMETARANAVQAIEQGTPVEEAAPAVARARTLTAQADELARDVEVAAQGDALAPMEQASAGVASLLQRSQDVLRDVQLAVLEKSRRDDRERTASIARLVAEARALLTQTQNDLDAAAQGVTALADSGVDTGQLTRRLAALRNRVATTQTGVEDALESQDQNAATAARTAARTLRQEALAVREQTEGALDERQRLRVSLERVAARVEGLTGEITALLSELAQTIPTTRNAAAFQERADALTGQTAALRQRSATAVQALALPDAETVLEEAQQVRAAVLTLQTDVQTALEGARAARNQQFDRIATGIERSRATADQLETSIRNAATGLDGVEAEIAALETALADLTAATAGFETARAADDLEDATGAGRRVESIIAVLQNTLDRVEAARDARRNAEAAALQQVVTVANDTITATRALIEAELANSATIAGITEQHDALRNAQSRLDAIEATIAAAQTSNDRAAAEQALAAARSEREAVAVVLQRITETREGEAALLAQLETRARALREETNCLLQGAQQAFSKNAAAQPGLQRLATLAASIAQSVEQVLTAVVGADRVAAEQAWQAAQPVQGEFDRVLADLDQLIQNQQRQAQAAFRAAGVAYAALTVFVGDARALARENERLAADLADPLQRIEAVLEAANADLSRARQAAISGDAAGAETARDALAAARENARLALLDMRRIVEQAPPEPEPEPVPAPEPEPPVVTPPVQPPAQPPVEPPVAEPGPPRRILVSALNPSQRTDLYRGLLGLGFLDDQEISEDFLVRGAQDQKILQALARFNESEGVSGAKDVSPDQLRRLAAANTGVTDWERERIIPLMRVIPENTLWSYGLKRTIGSDTYSAVPEIATGAIDKNRELVRAFQTSISAPATGFFADQNQLLQALNRPVALSVNSTEGTASQDWYFNQNEEACFIWSYAKQITGAYLRPDAPVIVITKAKGEQTPDIGLSLGPANAFDNSPVTISSDRGTSATLDVDGASLVLPQQDDQADRTAITMLVRDRTVTISGKSILGTELSIQYSALGFSRAFKQIEDVCTLEVGFWSE